MEVRWIIQGPHFNRELAYFYDRDTIGAKAASLVQLPLDWVPPFVVISSAAYRAWIAAGQYDRSLSGIEHPDFYGDLGDCINRFRKVGAKTLIARSSATAESMLDRGRYESLICGMDVKEIEEAIRRVWLSFKEQHSEPTSEAIAVILQAHVTPAVAGHLSNERRVSKLVSTWLCELEDSLSQQTRQFSLRAKPRKSFKPIELLCTSAKVLELRLKGLAASLGDDRVRLHIEWLWDGNRLWIVQADPEQYFHGQKPGKLFTIASEPGAVSGLRAFVPAFQSKGPWKKIQSLRVFKDCDLPTGVVFVLEQKSTLRSLKKGKITRNLQNDLSELLKIPIVIRTDVKSGDQKFNLPRTDCVKDIQGAVRFLKQTVLFFEQNDVRDFCFIAHRFMPAVACAQAFSTPKLPRVRIDSSWGLPDGLQFYPHDSFEIDVSKQQIKQRLRSKSEYLDVDETGKWVERRAGRPWDWRKSLTRRELLQIAEYTNRVAHRLQKPVDVMFFVGVEPKSGHPPCLPWIYTSEQVRGTTDDRAYGRLVGIRINVTSVRDLELLGRKLAVIEPRSHPILRLRPTPEFVRSNDFLEQVATTCKHHGITVELEGSILSHAYYVLSRAGARIRSVDPFRPRSRQRFGKLVRNLIPLKIVSRGEAAKVHQVSAVQLVTLLKLKAVEEALELLAETEPDKTFEELADVLEVLTTVCDLYDRKFSDLMATAEKKRIERGGFEKGLVLIETEDVPLVGAETQQLFIAPEENVTHVPLVPGSLDVERRRVWSTGRNLRVALVPPEPSANRQITVPLRVLELEATVTYGAKDIVISLQPVGKDHDDPRQAWLPFPELTEPDRPRRS